MIPGRDRSDSQRLLKPLPDEIVPGGRGPGQVCYSSNLAGMLAPGIDPIVISVALSVILMFAVSKLTFDPQPATRRLLDLEES